MFRYQLTTRPVDHGTTPEGRGRRFTAENLPAFAHREYGSVYYSEPLAIEQIIHYSLIAVTECQALDGKVYTSALAGNKEGQASRIVTYTLSVNQNAGIQATGDYNGKQQIGYLTYAEVQERIRSGKWIEVIP